MFTKDTRLVDFVKLYDIQLPDNFLSELLEVTTEFSVGRVGTGYVKKSLRNCFSAGIQDEYFTTPLWSVIDNVVKDYNVTFNAEITTNNEGYAFLKYEKGGYYHSHTDSGVINRSLSVIITLNDDYEGGELCFFNGEYVISPKKNRMIAFPSSFMFPHEVKEVTAGTRYSIACWLI